MNFRKVYIRFLQKFYSNKVPLRVDSFSKIMFVLHNQKNNVITPYYLFL